jgi:hypothetical protein
MMTGDPEIHDWRTEWLAQPTTGNTNAADIRHLAVKQQRRLRAWHVAELLAAVVLLMFSAKVAWQDSTLEARLWAAAVWATTLVVTAFSLWNWHILWKANLQSVSEYAANYQMRCIASLRAARFGMGFLAVQTAIAVPWLTWDYLRQELTGMRYAASLAILSILVLGFWLWFTHRRRTALRELDEVRGSQQIPAD